MCLPSPSRHALGMHCSCTPCCAVHLQGAVQELQLRLKESCRERERLQKQHAGQLAAVGEQVQAQVAAFRSQQAQLRQEVERDLAAASGECLASYEAGVAALQGQLERQAATAERQQGELAEQAARLKAGLQQLLAALRAEVPPLPEAAQAALLCEGPALQPQLVEEAAWQVAQAVAQHVERAEAAAVHSALAALEERLLPGGAPPARPPSPRKLLSPCKRQQEEAAAAAAAAAQPQAPPSLEVSEGRLAALLGRSQELLAQLAAGEAQVGKLRQQVAALEATAAGTAHQFFQVRWGAGGWEQWHAVCNSRCVPRCLARLT